MLKLVILVLFSVVVLLSVFWKTLRKRLKRGARVGIALYAVLMVVRLSQTKTDQETLVNLGVTLGLFGALWLLVWAVTGWLQARKTM